MAKNLLLVMVVTVACAAVLTSRSVGVTEPALSPAIIKTVALTGVTGPIPPTALFTPSRKGLYRVSTYMTVTDVGGG